MGKLLLINIKSHFSNSLFLIQTIKLADKIFTIINFLTMKKLNNNSQLGETKYLTMDNSTSINQLSYKMNIYRSQKVPFPPPFSENLKRIQ